MSNKIKLSHAQVRAINKLGHGHASSTDYNHAVGKPQTWQALLKKGVVEKVPLNDLAFNRRPQAETMQWVRLTELGRAILEELHHDNRKEPVIYVPENSVETSTED